MKAQVKFSAALLLGTFGAVSATLAAHHESGVRQSAAGVPYATSRQHLRASACNRPYGPYFRQRPPMMRSPYMRPMRPMMPPLRGYMPAYPMQSPAAQTMPPQAADAVAAAATDDTTGAAASSTGAVSISQMRFNPPRITVKKGASVTWTQAESMPHTVTASDGSFGSERLSAGDAFTRTFDQAGRYLYYCSLHPSMRGEIVVVD